jgi:hypothetical protein
MLADTFLWASETLTNTKGDSLWAVMTCPFDQLISKSQDQDGRRSNNGVRIYGAKFWGHLMSKSLGPKQGRGITQIIRLFSSI